MKRFALSFILSMLFTIYTASPTKTAIAYELTPKEYAKKIILGKWSKSEWVCLLDLWHRESKWNPKANNPKSTAYGIPQILNMREDTPALRQVDKGIAYIEHRYKTPCLALNFHNKNNWY